MKSSIFFTILLLVPIVLHAQNTWTLKSCIEYGLKNGHSNQVYANEKKIADARAKEALAAYLPTVNLTGTLDDNVKVQETVIPAGIFGPNDIRVAFTKQFQINPMAQLDQTIFDQSLLTGLQANHYNQLQAQLNITKNEETQIYNICKAYFQIAVYRQQLDLLHSSNETYRGQIQVTQQQVNKGITLLKDLDKIKVNYNTSLAQIRVAETNLTLSENQLKFEMGFPIEEELALDPIAATPDFMMSTTDSLQQGVVTNRTDYKLLQVNSKLTQIDQRRLTNIIYPKLSAYARYGSIGFGDQLKQAWSSMSSYSTIGLKLSIPIIDFKRQAQITQSKYKALNSIANFKLEETRFQMELDNAKTKFIQEQANLQLHTENIKLAQSTFDTIHLQYQKGTTDLTEWLTAQNTLKESQSNYLIGTVGLLIVVLIGYNLWANKKKLDEKNTIPPKRSIRIPVKIAVAKEQLMEISIVKTGSIAPFKEVKALALSGGIIRQIHFELGDHVREGQVLAVMDRQTLQLDLQKAETNADKLEYDLKIYTELLQGNAATQEKVNEITKNHQNAINQVNQVKKNISDASIKAPISGIVSAKSAEQGMYVNAGGDIATIISLSKAKVTLNLTESEVYQVAQGQPVKIKTDVYPDKVFTGSISFISPQADATHSYRTEIMMNNTATSLLRSGTFVSVDFSKSSTEKMLVIPREAIIESIQNAAVYVGSDSIVHRKIIQTGKEVGENIQVLSGLRPEDIVVTSGQINLKEGSSVRASN